MTPMLASKYNEKRAKKLLEQNGILIVQEKYDGARVLLENGELYTRTGKQIIITNEDFKRELRFVSQEDYILDGELLALDSEGKILPRQIGNGIINSALKGNVTPEQQFKLMTFDCIIKNNPELMYQYRLMNTVMYARTPHIEPAPCYTANTLDEINELYNYHIGLGHEGIMVKSPTNIYQSKRVTDVMKLKEEKTADLKVIGIELGKGKYKNMVGSLICTTEDNNLLVCVGTGLTDELREKFPGNGTIVEVKYNQVIKDEHGRNSLFLPVFKGYRFDKTVANTFEELL